MITLAVTVNNETRIYPVHAVVTQTCDADGVWVDVNGPWMTDDDSTDCNNFSGADAEHINYLYHDGNMTACDFAGEVYELRINGVHDHDAIVDFFKGASA